MLYFRISSTDILIPREFLKVTRAIDEHTFSRYSGSGVWFPSKRFSSCSRIAEAKRTDPRDESVVIDCNAYNRRKQLQPTSLLKLVSTFLPSALCLLLQIARSCCFYTLESLRFVPFLSFFLSLFIFIIFIVNCHFIIDKSITRGSIYAIYVGRK